MHVLDVSGEPREIGRAIGEAARNELRESLEEVRAAVRTLDPETVQAHATDLMTMLRDWVPGFYEEILGIAEGADLLPAEVHLLASGVELVARSGRRQGVPECTTFGVLGSMADGGHVILGSNKDTLYRFRGRAMVVRRRTPGQPARLDFISLVGFQRFGNLNERGMAKLGTGVRTGQRGRSGLPSSASVELALSAQDLSAVQARYTSAPWASGWTSIVTDGTAMILAEASPSRVITEPVQAGMVVTTNHFVHPQMSALGPQPVDFPSSYVRRERMITLLSAKDRLTVQDAMAALRDHAHGPGNDSICRHNDAHEEGTIFSIIQRPALAEMWVALGHPCTSEFRRITL